MKLALKWTTMKTLPIVYWKTGPVAACIYIRLTFTSFLVTGLRNGQASSWRISSDTRSSHAFKLFSASEYRLFVVNDIRFESNSSAPEQHAKSAHAPWPTKGEPKVSLQLLSISSPNVDRFSKFFHWLSLSQICNLTLLLNIPPQPTALLHYLVKDKF